MNLGIKIVPRLIMRDRDGKLFIRYTPFLHDATGNELQGPCYDVEVGEPDSAHEAAKVSCKKALTDSLAAWLPRL